MSNEWKLRQACDICIADIGKEDAALSQRLYDYIEKNYGTVPSKDWDYALVDEILERMLNGKL